MGNLIHHIGIARQYGVPVVVAVNTFATDTPAELALIQKAAVEQGGAADAVICEHWEKGGEGARDLAEAVVKAGELKNEFKFLYPLGVVDQGKDRDHRPAGLRCRWSGL